MGLVLQLVVFYGREAFGVGVNCGTVGDVEVAGVKVPVRVVPEAVGSLEVLSRWVGFTDASICVVEV